MNKTMSDAQDDSKVQQDPPDAPDEKAESGSDVAGAPEEKTAPTEVMSAADAPEEDEVSSDDDIPNNTAVDGSISSEEKEEEAEMPSEEVGSRGGDEEPVAARLRSRNNKRRETSVTDNNETTSGKVASGPLKMKQTHMTRGKVSRRQFYTYSDYLIELTGVVIASVILILMYLMFFRDTLDTSGSLFLEDTLVLKDPRVPLTYPQHNIDQYARGLFRQYARMRALCLHVSSELGFSVDLKRYGLTRSVDQTATLPPPLNGKPGAPYFCLNALLDQFAAGEIYTIHEQQQHRNRGIEKLRTVLPTDNMDLARQVIDFISVRRDLNDHEAPDMMQTFDSIEMATNTQLGYLDDAVVARDLLALGVDKAQVHLVRYQMLQDLALTLHNAPGRYSDSACACGLYYGIPRNIIATRAYNRTFLLLDPEIVRVRGSGKLVLSADLPFHRTCPAGTNTRDISDALLATTGTDPSETTLLYYTDIDVVSVALANEGGNTHVSTVRKMLHLDGPQAMCVEHCSHLATVWADAADNYHLLPHERLAI